MTIGGYCVEKFGSKQRTKSQIGKASKRKGASGERDLATFLTANAFPARRGVQYQGGPDSPDIVCDKLSQFNIECKRTERLSLYKALKQSEDDCGVDQDPIVFHRQNSQEWVTILKSEHFLAIMRDLERLNSIVAKVIDSEES